MPKVTSHLQQQRPSGLTSLPPTSLRKASSPALSTGTLVQGLVPSFKGPPPPTFLASSSPDAGCFLTLQNQLLPSPRPFLPQLTVSHGQGSSDFNVLVFTEMQLAYPLRTCTVCSMFICYICVLRYQCRRSVLANTSPGHIAAACLR